MSLFLILCHPKEGHNVAHDGLVGPIGGYDHAHLNCVNGKTKRELKKHSAIMLW
jgi:hypothetical protein